MFRRFGLWWLSAQWQPHSDQLQQWIAASAADGEALTLARTYIQGLDFDAAVTELQDAVDLLSLCHKVSYPAGSHISQRLHSAFNAQAGQLNVRLVEDIARLGLQYPGLMAEFCQIAATQPRVLRQLDAVLSSSSSSSSSSSTSSSSPSSFLSLDALLQFAEAVWAAQRVTAANRHSPGVYKAVLFSLAQVLARHLRGAQKLCERPQPQGQQKDGRQCLLLLLLRLAELRAPLWTRRVQSTSQTAAVPAKQGTVSDVTREGSTEAERGMSLSTQITSSITTTRTMFSSPMATLAEEVLRCTRVALHALHDIVELLQALARASLAEDMPATTQRNNGSHAMTTKTHYFTHSYEVCYVPWMNVLQELLCTHAAEDRSGALLVRALRALSCAHIALHDTLVRQLCERAADCCLAALYDMVSVWDAYALREELVLPCGMSDAGAVEDAGKEQQEKRENGRGLGRADTQGRAVRPAHAGLLAWHQTLLRRVQDELRDLVKASRTLRKAHTLYQLLAMLSILDPAQARALIAQRAEQDMTFTLVAPSHAEEIHWACVLLCRAHLSTSAAAPPAILRGIAQAATGPVKALGRRQAIAVLYMCLRAKLPASPELLPHILHGVSSRKFVHRNTPARLTRRQKTSARTKEQPQLLLYNTQEDDDEEERLDVPALYMLCECVLHHRSLSAHSVADHIKASRPDAHLTQLLQSTPLDKAELFALLRRLGHADTTDTYGEAGGGEGGEEVEGQDAAASEDSVQRGLLCLQLAQLLVQRDLAQLTAHEVLDVMEAYAAADCRDAVTLQALLHRLSALHQVRPLPLRLICRAAWATRRLRLVPHLTRSGLLDLLTTGSTHTRKNDEEEEEEGLLIASGADLMELLQCCPPAERGKVLQNVPHGEALLSALPLTSLSTAALCVLLALSHPRRGEGEETMTRYNASSTDVNEKETKEKKSTSCGGIDTSALLHELSKRNPLQPQAQTTTTTTTTTTNRNNSTNASTSPNGSVSELTVEDVVCTLEALPHDAEVLRIVFRTLGPVLVHADETQLLRLYRIVTACRPSCPLLVFRTLGKALLHAVPQMTPEAAALWLSLYAGRQIRDDSVGKALIRRISARPGELSGKLVRQFERDAMFYGIDVGDRMLAARKKRRSKSSLWLLGHAESMLH